MRSPRRHGHGLPESYGKIGGAGLLVLALFAGFLVGRSWPRGPAGASSKAAEPATAPAPEAGNLRTGQRAGSAAAAELANKLSASVDAVGCRVRAWAHGLRDAAKGAGWKVRLWLARGSVRRAASALAAGGAALARSGPAHLGHGVLHAAAAARWATWVPRTPWVAAVPWVVAAVSLCAALHSLGLLGAYAGQAAEERPPASPAPSLPEREASPAQAVLTLEVGIAIGAGSALFVMWVTRQKWAEWVLTRSLCPCPNVDVTPDKKDDLEPWPVFTGSKSAEAQVRAPTTGDDDAGGILSGYKQYFRRTGDGKTVVGAHYSFSGSSSDACRT
mmetsp:Transcript_80982/g.196353  ORF Transcript_80982/g.196353 Transcript_80982/m.196353 type:complete len:331 (-) Transcript_80982:166-1158(-)